MKKILKELKPKSNTDTELKDEQETEDNLGSLDTLNIHIIGATLLAWLARKPKHIIFAIIITDIKKALALKKYTNPTIKVLVYYYKYLKVFL